MVVSIPGKVVVAVTGARMFPQPVDDECLDAPEAAMSPDGAVQGGEIGR